MPIACGRRWRTSPQRLKPARSKDSIEWRFFPRFFHLFSLSISFLESFLVGKNKRAPHCCAKNRCRLHSAPGRHNDDESAVHIPSLSMCMTATCHAAPSSSMSEQGFSITKERVLHLCFLVQIFTAKLNLAKAYKNWNAINNGCLFMIPGSRRISHLRYVSLVLSWFCILVKCRKTLI